MEQQEKKNLDKGRDENEGRDETVQGSAETGEERTGRRTIVSQRRSWTSTTATTGTTCKRMRGDGGMSKQRECAEDMVTEIHHDTTRSCELPSKGSVVLIRKVYEARRCSATVQGLAECKKQHTAHIKEQHGEQCDWQVQEW